MRGARRASQRQWPDIRPDVREGAHVREFDISILLYPGVHDPSAIFGRDVVADERRHGVPVANRELGRELFDDSARRGLQSSILRVHFVELRERGVEVSLFENLSAVDQATVERREVDHAPLGIETLL